MIKSSRHQYRGGAIVITTTEYAGRFDIDYSFTLSLGRLLIARPVAANHKYNCRDDAIKALLEQIMDEVDRLLEKRQYGLQAIG